MRSPVAHQRERAADRRLGRDVQHDGAEGGAAHARVGDAHHVLDALRARASSGSAGSRPRACPARRSGPALRSTSTSSAVTSRSGSSMRAARSSSESNTTARPVWRSSVGVAADVLDDRAARARGCRAAPPCCRCGLIGCGARADDVLAGHRLGAVDRRRASVPPVTVGASRSSSVVELAQQARHAAGPVEVLHVVRAGGLQVDQHRHLAAERGRTRRGRSRCPSAAGDGGEVDQRVGGAADRLQHDHRVAERRARS